MSQYEIQFGPYFEKSLRKLDQRAVKKLGQKIERIRSFGMPQDVERVRMLPGCLKTRIGDHRLLFSVKNDVFILSLIEDRKDVYK